jgi:hypothetical protein
VEKKTDTVFITALSSEEVVGTESQEILHSGNAIERLDEILMEQVKRFTEERSGKPLQS